MKDFKPYLNILDSMISLFDDMLTLETHKLDAVARHDMSELEKYMKDEQAFTMRLRGLDVKRGKALEELGFPGATLKQVLAQVDGEDKTIIEQKSLLLEEKTVELKSALKCAAKCIDYHLKAIDTILNGEQEEQPVKDDSKPVVFKSRKI